jgi:hypothetical protein
MTGKMDWAKAGLRSKEKISTKTEADRMKWDRASRWLNKETNKKLRAKKFFAARRSGNASLR